jgi:hypothetical protein
MSGATRAWEASVIDRRRRFEFSIRRQTSRAAVERHSGDARVNPDMAARRNGRCWQCSMSGSSSAPYPSGSNPTAPEVAQLARPEFDPEAPFKIGPTNDRDAPDAVIPVFASQHSKHSLVVIIPHRQGAASWFDGSRRGLCRLAQSLAHSFSPTSGRIRVARIRTWPISEIAASTRS